MNPPDDLSRRQIIEINLKSLPLASDINVDELVLRTQGFSGAEVVSICTEAACLAMDSDKDQLAQSHLLAAIDAVKPQITPAMLDFYKQFLTKFQF